MITPWQDRLKHILVLLQVKASSSTSGIQSLATLLKENKFKKLSDFTCQVIFYVYSGKWTVVVISSDSSFKLVHVGFTTVPFKPLSDQKYGRYCRFSSLKVFSSDNYFHCFCSRNRYFKSKTTVENNQFITRKNMDISCRMINLHFKAISEPISAVYALKFN